MFCPNCGKENPEGNANCFSCGAALPTQATMQTSEDAVVAAVTGAEAVAAEVVATEVTADPTASATATTGDVAANNVVTSGTIPGAVSIPASVTQVAAETQATQPAAVQPTVAVPVQPAAQTAAQPQNAPYQQAVPVQEQPQAQTQDQAQAAAQAQPQSTPYQQAASQTAAQPQPQAQPQAQTAYTYQQVPPQQAAAQPVAQPQQIYKKGCVACAWDDIKNSDGWFGRTMLMGLINIVPILNWVVPGYCMRWARQLPMGKIQSMPKSIFGGRNFINGVYWFVLSLVFGLVGGIAGGIVGIVPIIGWLAGIAIAIFLSMFLNLAYMRTAVADRLGAGFDISALWAALKKNPGSLLCVSIVPALIIGACVSIVATIIFGIAAIGIGGDIINLAYMTDYSPYYYDYFDYGYGYDYGYGSAAALSILSMLGKMIPAFLVVYIIGCFAQAFQYVLVLRAMGHWTARYAASWVNEPAIQASAYLYPDQE